MNSPALQKWSQSYRKRREKSETIEASLLKGDMIGYYFFRLRYFLIRSIIGALIFSIELKILIEGFGKDFFAQSLGARTLLVLIMAFWWAGLELLRSKIRELRNQDKSFLTPKVIFVWLQYSLGLSIKLVATLLYCLSLLSLLKPELVYSPYGFYILTLIIRLGIDLPLRTYHSSVYATTRVYRPIYWILASEIISFILFLTLFPVIGAWSVGISSLVSLTLGTSVSYYYITQSFRYLGYKTKLGLIKLRERDKSLLPSFYKIAAQAIPLTLLRLDAVLIILLLLTTSFQRTPEAYHALIVICLCIPLLHAAQEWGILLYFDYKKLELQLFKKLREKFTSSIKYLVIALAIALWLLLPVLTWISGLGFITPPIAILALLLSSSYLGQQTIRVFSLGSNKDLLFWGLTLLGALIIMLTLTQNVAIDYRVLLTSSILFLVSFAMNIACKEKSNPSQGILCPPTHWLGKLKESTQPWAGVITIDNNQVHKPNHTKFLVKEIAIALKKAMPHKIHICRFSDTKITFFAEWSLKNNITNNLIREISSLAPTEIKNIVIFQEGLGATKLLEEISKHEERLKPCLEPSPPHVIKPKDTIIFDFKNKVTNISKQDCKEIMTSSIKYFHNIDRKTKNDSKGWSVCCKEKDGFIDTIYALPKTHRNKFSQWQKTFTNRVLWEAWNKNSSIT